MLLHYVHIFLLLASFTYYNFNGNMFAQEITEAITPTNVIASEAKQSTETTEQTQEEEEQTQIEQSIPSVETTEISSLQTETTENSSTETIVDANIIPTETTEQTQEKEQTQTEQPTPSVETIETSTTDPVIASETKQSTDVIASETQSTDVIASEAKQSTELIPTITGTITEQPTPLTSPDQITGLSLWLETIKSSNLQITNSGKIQSRRSSFQNQKLRNTNEEQQPYHHTGVIFYQPGIYFDGTSSLQSSLKLEDNYTIILFFNKEKSSPTTGNIIYGDHNRGLQISENDLIYNLSGITAQRYSLRNSDFNLVQIIVSTTGTTLIINNTPLTIENPENITPGNIRLGATELLSGFQGHIAEIMVFNTTIDQQTQEFITRYFQQTYGNRSSSRIEPVITNDPVIASEAKQSTEPTETSTGTKLETKEQEPLSEKTNEETKIEEKSIEPIIEEKTTITTGTELGIKETPKSIELPQTHTFTKAFKTNEQDPEIGILQTILTQLGFYNNEITNTYDQNTIDAVFAFQKSQGLITEQTNKKTRGFFGPGTRKAINKIITNNQLSPKETNNETELSNDPSIIISQNSGEIKKSLEIKKELFKNHLEQKGFKKSKNSLKKNSEALIGNKNIDLEEISGAVIEPTILQSINDLSGQIAEVELPADSIFVDTNGEQYTGTLQAPVFYDNKIADEIPNQEIIATIKVGAEEKINITDSLGTLQEATIRIPTPGYEIGEILTINTSQDGNERYESITTPVILINNEPYIEFTTNHFTIFSIGALTGSFTINNDNSTTTGTSVILNNNVPGATHMRFGNSIAQRDAASWITYQSSYPRTLSGTNDEIKRVYAQFSGNGMIRNVADSIILETTEDVLASGLVTHLDGSFTTTTFYDIGGLGYNFTASTTNINGMWSIEQIMNFSGSNFLSRATTPTISTTPFTISAWVKPDRVSGTQGIVFRGRSTTNNIYYGINLSNTTFQITARNTTARTANGTIAAQVGQRYHVVGVFSANNSRRIYVNAVTGNVSTNTVNRDNTSQHRTIGKYPGTATNYFSGSIDEVRIYNKALTINEIQSLYMITPTFDTQTAFTGTPTLYGTLPEKIANITLLINENTYTTTGAGNGKWKTNPMITGLNNGTYNVTLNYTNVYGKTGTATYTNGLTIALPSSTGLRIAYNTTLRTNQDVIATLTGRDPTYMIVNNGGSESYTFTGNNTFTYQFVDKQGTTGTLEANVTWIDKTSPTFAGVTSGSTYTGNVTITFADTNLSGATLNGSPYFSGTNITGEGNYEFIVYDLAGNSTGATFKIEFPLEQKIENELINLGYQTSTTGLITLDDTFFIGTANINLAPFTGQLLQPTLLRTTDTFGGNIAEIEIPRGAILQNSDTSPFTGILQAPTFQTPSTYETVLGKSIISAVQVGSTNHIYFKDTINNDLETTFRMPVPGKSAGDLIDIYTSENGTTFTYLTTVHVFLIGSDPYVSFQSTHFSVVVTSANNGTNISADKAANSTSGSAYTLLNNIVIAEALNGDLAANQTNTTLILTAPTNWKFRQGSGTINYTAGMDITAASINVTGNTITVTFTTDNNANKKDTITISNIQIQAITGNLIPSSGNIMRLSSNPGTANIVGITNNVTNFGSLSQTVGTHKNLVITLPGQTFTAGQGNSGTPIDQTQNIQFTIPSITATDQFYNIITTYAGTKTLSYTGANGTPNYTTSVNFTNGQSTTPLLTTLTNIENNITLTVSDGIITGPASSIFNVLADIYLDFAGVISGTSYSGDVTITYTGNNLSGAIVSGVNTSYYSGNFTNGGTITGDGKYIFTLSDIYANSTGAIFTIDKTKPTATIIYTPNSGERLGGDVIATITGFSEAITGLNATGYTFTGNGSFDFTYQDLVGNTGLTTATVDWITTGTNQPPYLIPPYATKAGGSLDDIPYGVDIDNEGNQYIAGVYRGTADFWGTTLISSGNSNDIFIAKMTPNGQRHRVLSAGGTGAGDVGRGVSVDSNGNVYVMGRFQGIADMFGITKTSLGTNDAFVAKLNSSGEILRVSQGGGAGGATDVRGKHGDNAGNTYIGGYYNSSSVNMFGTVLTHDGGNDGFVAKVDTNGNGVWARKVGGTASAIVLSTETDESNNVYVAGEFFGTADIFGISKTSAGDKDIFYAKLDSNGNTIWVETLGSTGADSSNIIHTFAGSIYLGATFSNTITIDTETFTSSGARDIFIARMDYNGNINKVVKGGGVGDEDLISLDSDGYANLYAGGKFQGTSDFFGFTTTAPGASNQDEGFIVKLNANLKGITAAKTGGPAQDQLKGIAVSNAGFISSVGMYRSNPCDIFGTALTNSGTNTYDVWLSKIEMIGPTATVTYDPATYTTGSVVATLTGFNKPVTITNNSGSQYYTFTGNGNFTFTYIDEQGIAGETTATVTWIITENLSIGGSTGMNFATGIQASTTTQEITGDFGSAFRVSDPVGTDSGYYTTISITNLEGTFYTITNDNISFKANTLTTLDGTTNPNVVLASGATNYQTLASPITYIKRDPGTNSGITGRYGDIPTLKVNLPAYINPDSYQATLTYTLYEN